MIFSFVAETGGVVGSCSELSCYFGAVCTERTGGALCECAAAACSDSDTNMLVSFVSIYLLYGKLYAIKSCFKEQNRGMVQFYRGLERLIHAC